ncbi:O-antigen ligase family protein [Bradyrhizobium sp. BR 1432]|uniref:O-antigen ligase family protein n=1 Tax=Bradyrhizobium sp. BR 1432 TaxID=3447966 RepID=UPI003EE6CE68
MPRYSIGSGKLRRRHIPAFQVVSPLHKEQGLAGSYQAGRKQLSWPVLLFFLALLWPCQLYVGSLRLSLYRIVLLVMILPCLSKFAAGRVGIKISDVAVLLFSFWRVLGLIVVDGIESSSQTFGIEWIETIGPYLLARCFIRDADDFYNMIQLLFRIVLVLLPFAIIELVSGHNILRELFAMICPTPLFSPEQRSGLTRVQSVFDHPILFGVFAASALAPVYLVLGHKMSLLRRNLMTAAVAATASMSLSAGPLMAIVAQGLLLSWDSLLRGVKARWKILIGLLAVVVTLIEAVANRSLPSIVSGYLTFDPQSYYFRLLIWDYGSAVALDHPVFGIGLSDWERPNWMGPSIDNFWLVLAMRSGLPAPVLLHLAILLIFLTVGSKKGLDGKITAYRTAFLIAMAGIYLVGWTVHFWDTAYVAFLFLLGSGAWVLDVDAETSERASSRSPARKVRYGAPAE